MKYRYAVLQLNTEIEVNVMGRAIEVPLSYVEGMVGAIPVFDTLKNAEVFAGDKYQIAEIEIKK